MDLPDISGYRTEVLTVIVVGLAAGFLIPELTSSNKVEEENWRSEIDNATVQNATFAGGCFWCIEEVFQGEPGVESAVSGFTGGRESTADYDLVVTGETDHRESVRVQYYPSVISYREMLDIYWTSIDPTDPGGQFSDRGYQYTTAIYTHTDRQYQLAKQSKENLTESNKFEEEIVTEVLNATEFYPAADKHQNYSQKNAVQYKAYKQASGRAGFIERVWN